MENIEWFVHYNNEPYKVIEEREDEVILRHRFCWDDKLIIPRSEFERMTKCRLI